MKFDGKAFGQEIVSIVKGYVGETLATILDRLDALEKRHPEKGEKGAPGERGPEGPSGKDGRDGKDGLDAVEFIRDARGHLIATMSNGTTRDLGQIAGEKGEPGRDGRDGQDGVGFDDLEVVYDGARHFTFRFVKGEQVKEFPFTVPVMIYRGVYRDDEAYSPGDTVTWGGSLWHCDADTTDKPDGQQKAWTLAAKRGRDGKDGAAKAERPKQPIKVS